ncbi:polycystin-1-like protein 2 isoform X2 [Pogona vitticeps]
MAWRLPIPASLALLLGTLGRMAGPAPRAPGAVPERPRGMCYHLVREKMPYGRAWVACRHWGSRLAHVHWAATREALRTELAGAPSWWVAAEDPLGTGIRPWPESHHPRGLPACAFLSRRGMLRRGLGAVCLERHPVICEFGPGQGAECPLQRARSPTARAGKTPETHQEPPSRGSLVGGRRRTQRLRRFLGHEEEEPYPEMTAIWEALQSVQPKNWQQELVHRLSLPVQEDDGFGSASKMDEEMRLFQAVSEHLLQRDARASPHWPLLSILALRGCSRLLQASLGRCSPGPAMNIQQQQQEAALARSVMQILHRLEKAMWQDKEGILESALISISAHRFISSDLGNTTLSFPGHPKAARVILPGPSALEAFLPPGTLIRVQLASFLGSPFSSSSSSQKEVTGVVAELDLLAGETEIFVSNLSDPVQVFLPQTAPAHSAPAFHVSPGEALLLTVNVTWTEASLMLHTQPEPREPWGLFRLSQHRLEAVEPSLVEDQGGRTWLVGPASLPVRDGASRFLLVPLNLSVGAPLALRLGAYGVRCVSWHPDSGQWSEEGCAVGPLSRWGEVHCLCSHLSFYGSAFWVMPVQVDVVRTAEYFALLGENPIMLILMGVLYAFFLGTAAWARWMDMRTQPQIRPVLLDDDPCAQYGYLLCISPPGPPGHDSDSCRVCLWLQGSSGTSKPRSLPPSGTLFLLREPCPLGELQSIWLWQESPMPPRYVTQVTVQDLQERGRFHFPCHAWLTRGEDGLCAPQHFLAAPRDPTFWTIFWQRVLCGFRDEHSVLLVLRPPPHTAFTRVQRISCFWCLLLCSSLISLMFWETADESPPLLSVGSYFSFAWKDVAVSAESALIAFPINFLLVFLFQNTKPRRSEGALRIVARPDAPADPRSLDAAVLENLRSAVETFSRARMLPGSFGLQCSLTPSLDLEGLLHLLARMILPGPEGEADSAGTEPSPDASHESYSKRYVLRKLQQVARLLEEEEAGPASARHAQALEQVRALAGALDTHLPPVPQAHKKRRWSLPWWSVFVSWALLVSLSAVSTFFVLLYGFHYGRESIERWLVSTAISLCQNLFVLQPLKVVIFALFFALALKKPEEEEDDDEMSLEFPIEGPGSLQ